ncbi:MAG: GGDEF domain-containing protein [Pseudomonadota bacterium]|nr:GGDEF domain-containing protein [Pseudomonadota bacterium]
MSHQENWKRKYRELALEAERREHADARVKSELTALAEQMALGLQGVSPELDSELSSLREALKAEDTERMTSLSRQVRDRVRQLDQDRHRAADDLARVLRRWSNQLRRVNRVASVDNLLANVEKRIPDAVEQLDTLPDLLLDLIELQHGMLASSPAVATAENDFALNADANQKLELLRSSITAELLQLLEALQLPAEGVGRARELVRQLEAGVQLEQLPVVLATVVELVRLAGGNTQEEFENYLLALNSQLSCVQQFLEESRSDEAQAVKAHHRLDSTVRQEVCNIHHTVDEAEDLDQLKQSVAQRLASIVHSMDSYRQQEQKRQERLNQRYEKLLDKIEQMELETSKAKARMQEEQLRARTDPLTGLPNRTAYEQHLEAEIERWRRYQVPFSMAVGDIDFFKKINDELGHLAGDRVLRLVSKVLKHNLRSTDFIARFGGEEFVILFPSTRIDEAYRASEKLRQAITASPFNFRGERVEITISFGIAEVAAGDDSESLFVRADNALYQAKQQGRNQTRKATAG